MTLGLKVCIRVSLMLILQSFQKHSKDNFIFGFLLAYGESKATITRLKKGDLNQLESNGEERLEYLFGLHEEMMAEEKR